MANLEPPQQALAAAAAGAGPPARPILALLRLPLSAIHMLALRRRRRLDRLLLPQLSDQLLKDIGFSRDQIDRDL
jgi:uncharacterized protein YjiS (DUF1127 family)